MSSFSSINTALSGLLTQRRALDVIGHNIANTSTEGYSRRRVEMTAAGAWAVPAMYSRSTISGNGVTVSAVTRIRDDFLEMRALREHGASQRLDVESTMLSRLEQTLPEPSDMGLAAQLGDFYASWDDAANTPADSAGRIAVLQQATTVASTLNRVSADMVALRDAAVQEAVSLVAVVNTTAAQVAQLNESIAQANAAGLDPHDLADQRDLLVAKLADLAGVTVRQGELGTVDLSIGGSTLVSGKQAEQLSVAELGPLSGPYAATGLDRVGIAWVVDGYPASLDSGRLAGLLSSVNAQIPQTLSELDSVAESLVDTVNSLHLGGQGLDTVNDVGLAFWDPAGTTAATIRLSSDVAGQPSRLAVAAAGSGALDSTIAQQIAELHQAPLSADTAYQNMIGRLAIEVQAVESRSMIQSNVATQADDARISVSGVNLDEELSNLITTQRAYEAAARLLTTVDSTLDTLINRTGLVGR